MSTCYELIVLIEMFVPSKENKRFPICLQEVSILPMSTIFLSELRVDPDFRVTVTLATPEVV